MCPGGVAIVPDGNPKKLEPMVLGEVVVWLEDFIGVKNRKSLL